MNIATLPLASADTAAFCEGARLLPVRGVRGGQPFAVQDWVAEEVPVALGAVMGLLLAFRLNASYGRWWEGRLLWGNIILR